LEFHIPEIVTAGEAADLLGASAGQVEQWAMDGLLSACARSESGQLLFYRWRVEKLGPKLAAGELARFKKDRRRTRHGHGMFHDCRRLPCGCAIASERGDQDGESANQPVWLCADARALQSAERLAAAFAMAAPGAPFFRRLADVTREAFERHIADPAQRNATAPPGRDGGQSLCAFKPLLAIARCFGGVPNKRGKRCLQEPRAQPLQPRRRPLAIPLQPRSGAD
jgi:hypothetical protein